MVNTALSRLWRPSALTALAASMAVSGVSLIVSTTAGQTTAAPSTMATEIEGFSFEQDIVVAAGTRVRWHNGDGADHTVTADDGSFDSGSLQPNATFERVFSEPGVVSYSCTIHPSMTATITVQPPGGDQGAPATLGDIGAFEGSVVLRRTTVFDTDPVGIAGPALTVLVPRGWVVQGGPVWRHHYSNLATFEGRIASPDLRRSVEFFAIFPQIWQEGGIPFFPEGSNYLGNDVRPPIRDVGAFLDTLILPAYRGAFGPRIIAREALPEVAAAYVAASLPGTEVAAERVLTEHFVDGERMLEEFTVVLTFTPNPGLPGAVSWSAQQLFSIRAPEAEFDAIRPVLQAIATSPVLELEWYAGYQYVLGLSIRNGLEAIRAAGAASRIIAEANAEISDIIVSGYQERQVVNDRIFDAVSQAIRGVETYADPFGGTLELPNGYQYAYASDDGSVILSNEPGFDPALALPQQTWELLTVQR